MEVMMIIGRIPRQNPDDDGNRYQAPVAVIVDKAPDDSGDHGSDCYGIHVSPSQGKPVEVPDKIRPEPDIGSTCKTRCQWGEVSRISTFAV